MSYNPEDMIYERYLSTGELFSISVDDGDLTALNPWNSKGDKPEQDPVLVKAEQELEIQKNPEIASLYTRELVCFEPDKVLSEVRSYHQKCQDRGLDFLPYTYYVARDGFWHHDRIALYCYFEREPFLTPNEWLEKQLVIDQERQRKRGPNT